MFRYLALLTILLAFETSSSFGNPTDTAVKLIDAATGKVPKLVNEAGNAGEKIVDAVKGQPRIKNSDVVTDVYIKQSHINQAGKNGKLNIGTKIRNANIKNSEIRTKIRLRNVDVRQKGEGGELNIGTDIE